MSRSLYSFGEHVAGEGLALFLPRSWSPGDSRAIIWCHSLGGDSLQGSAPESMPGAARLIAGLARRFPVVVADLGGISTCGNATAVTRIGQAKAWVEGNIGSSTGPALLAGASMGGWAGLNYAADNDVGAMVFAMPGISLGDVRRNNRPNGWAGTTQNNPANCGTINTAWGLPFSSTDDYPTHGTSFAALPAGADPYTRTAELIGLRALFYSSSNDTTMLPSIQTLFVSTIGAPATSRSLGALGHTDTAIGAVPVDEAIDWFLAA